MDSRTKGIVALVLVVLFSGCVAIGGIQSCVNRKNIERDLTRIEFSTSKEVLAYCADNNVRYSSDDHDVWSAKNSDYDDIVAILNNRYLELKEVEYQESLENHIGKLLENPPSSNVNTYRNTLLDIGEKIEDIELKQKIKDELERIEPIFAKEKQIIEAERQKQAAKKEESERVEKLKEDALAISKAAWQIAYPAGTYNWATEVVAVQTNGNVFVSFEYSVKNAFNARIQRRASFLYTPELEVVDTQDEYLYVRDD